MGDFTEAIRVEFNATHHTFESVVLKVLSGLNCFSKCSMSRQYRAVIWFQTPEEKAAIDRAVATICQRHNKKLTQFAVDIEPLKTFHKAEEYHQHYVLKSRGKYDG